MDIILELDICNLLCSNIYIVFWITVSYLSRSYIDIHTGQRVVMAAGRKVFMPPTLHDVNAFDNWLQEIELWQCITDLEAKKQGRTMYLSLDEKIRNSCTDIAVQDLNSDDGVHLLITKLKKLYAKDSQHSAYIAYDHLENIKWPDNIIQ